MALAFRPDSTTNPLSIKLSTMEVIRAALRRVCFANSILEIVGLVWMSFSTFHSFRNDLRANTVCLDGKLRMPGFIFVRFIAFAAALPKAA
jgi:hypothetical protein